MGMLRKPPRSQVVGKAYNEGFSQYPQRAKLFLAGSVERLGITRATEKTESCHLARSPLATWLPKRSNRLSSFDLLSLAERHLHIVS